MVLKNHTHSKNNSIMAQFTLTQRSSHIQSRLQQLFHSFHTPTHPPYALMINRAVTELNDENGSTEEAISEFVRREYEDLPWAHSKILSLHLKRMCEVGELLCDENGRYVVSVGGKEEKEKCKGRRKRKRGNRKGYRNDGEKGLQLSVFDNAGTDEAFVQVTKSDHSIGNVEKQVQSEKGIVEHNQMVSSTICAEGSPEYITSTDPGIEPSSPAQLQPQISTDVTAALTCVNVDNDEFSQDYDKGNVNGNFDETPLSECLEQIQPKPKRSRGRSRKSETDANCQEELLLLKQGPKKNKKEKHGQTRSRGRAPKVNQDTEPCEMKLKKKDQVKLRNCEDKLKKNDQKLCDNEEKLEKKEKAKLCNREEKLKKKEQAKLCGPEDKLKKKDQAKLCSQGRSRGRGRGRGRLPKPKVCDTIAEAPDAEATTM